MAKFSSRASKAGKSRKSAKIPKSVETILKVVEGGEDPELQDQPGTTVAQKAHQIAHSMLWSAYVGLLTERDVERYNNRYRLFTVSEIAGYLLAAWDLHRSKEKPDKEWPLSKGLVKLGLWHLHPLFDEVGSLVEPLSIAFRQGFGVNRAAFPADGLGRPAFPNFPELGIQDSRLATTMYRRTARVRLECTVLRSYRVLRDMVYPWHWTAGPFWMKPPTSSVPPEVGQFWRDSDLRMIVHLPGGELVRKSKYREVSLDLEVMNSPFQARVDYDGREIGSVRNRSLEFKTRLNLALKARALPDASKNQNTPAASNGVEIDLGDFNGYMLVEKLAGRPGACRVVFEREASFVDVNHGLLCKETLWYWVTSEMISFVESALVRNVPRKDGRAA